MAAGAGLDGDAKRFASLGQSLTAIAEIAQGCSLEAASGQLMQHRDDALAVMLVRRRDVYRQRKAVFIDCEMDSGQSHFKFERGLWRGMCPSIRPA